MSSVRLLVLPLVLAGCSFVGGDALPFRPLTTVVSIGYPPAPALARTAAEAEGLAERVGLAETPTADFARETILAVSTHAACPSTNHESTVRSVEARGDGVVVRAEVERVGEFGGGALSYPVAVVAVEGLGAGDRVEVRLSGDDEDCLLE